MNISKAVSGAYTDYLTIDTTGNVGIGLPSANQKLSVAGTGAFYNSTQLQPSGVRGLFMGNFSGGSSIWSYNYLTGTGDSLNLSAQDLNFNTYTSGGSGISRMFVSNAGNVGIGTTNPVFDANVGKYLTLDGGSGGIGSIGAAGGTGSAGTAVSQVAFINSSLGTSDKRLATIVGSTDATTNSGMLDFYTASAGVFPTMRLRITSDGNVGIGTAAPSTKLQVAGGTRVDGTTGRVYLGTAAVTGARGLEFVEENATTFSIRHHDPNVAWRNIAINPHGGNVGIGTTTPSAKLDVQGGAVNASEGLCIADICKGSWAEVVGASGGTQWSPPNAGGHINNTNAGNVGIGTSAPAALLDLASTTQIGNRLLLSGQEFFAAGNTSTSGVALRIGTNRAGERQLWIADSAQAINATNAQLRMRFFSSSASLDALSTDGTDVRPLILQSVGGNVGVGTTAPASLLHVYSTANNSHAIQIDAQGPGDAQQATINLITLGDGAKTVLGAGTKGWHFTARGNAFSNTAEQNDLQLYSWNGSNISTIQSWDYATGNVGINTSTPNSNYKLDVNGDTNVTGNFNTTGAVTGGTIHAKYQDVAEWVESSQTLAAGTVVVLDHTRSNQVIASSQAYDTRVAGVISFQPGITLGESGAGKVLVATTGRVKIKVDATAGPIQIGDLLVTSDKEGVAKKSEPLTLGGVAIHRPGTLIGKALEPLAGGTGEILVLLSLQ